MKDYLDSFGENGNVSAVPDTAQGGGELSLQEGWGSDYDLDLATQTNAKAILRTQHNQLWQGITGNINFWQQNLYPLYTPAASNGGTAVVYPFGTRVRYDAGSGLNVYEVINAAGTNSLPSSAANWVLASVAYPRSGTAGGEQRTNTQNDSRFLIAGTSGGQVRTNTQNDARFQAPGDYMPSSDGAGILARGFALAPVPPLIPVETSQTGSFVADLSFPGASMGAMTVDGENGDIFVNSSTVIYKSIGGTGPFLAIGSYPGSGATGIDVDWTTKDVIVCDTTDVVYKLPGGAGTFSLFGSYDSIPSATGASDVAIDQVTHDIVIGDNSLDRFSISRGGAGDF